MRNVFEHLLHSRRTWDEYISTQNAERPFIIPYCTPNAMWYNLNSRNKRFEIRGDYFAEYINRVASFGGMALYLSKLDALQSFSLFFQHPDVRHSVVFTRECHYSGRSLTHRKNMADYDRTGQSSRFNTRPSLRVSLPNTYCPHDAFGTDKSTRRNARRLARHSLDVPNGYGLPKIWNLRGDNFTAIN